MPRRRRVLHAVAGGGIVGLSGCVGGDGTVGAGDAGATATHERPAIGDGELVLATTTSTYDTGLLGELTPRFERAYGVTVKTIPKGTGASLRTARDGDADAILVHARSAEDAFIRDGFGVNRRSVMFNDFVVVGPADDPAGIGGIESATGAFERIADRGAVFVSRGDDSGTHKKERAIWAASHVDPGGRWYRAVGKGMGDTLVQADQTGAYTLADRGTYLSMRDELDLAIHVQGPLNGGPVLLKNPYGVMAVNPAKYDDVNYRAAMAYVGFLTSPETQTAISNYTVNGRQLFFPDAVSEEPDFAQYVPRGYTAEEARSLSLADREYLYRVDRRVPADY